MTLVLVYTLSKTILGHSFFNYILVIVIPTKLLLYFFSSFFKADGYDYQKCSISLYFHVHTHVGDTFLSSWTGFWTRLYYVIGQCNCTCVSLFMCVCVCVCIYDVI